MPRSLAFGRLRTVATLSSLSILGIAAMALQRSQLSPAKSLPIRPETSPPSSPAPSAAQSPDPDVNTGAMDYLSVQEAGRCGLYTANLNKAGRLVDDFVQFNNAGNFSEGLARVPVQGKCGYINLDGKLVIPAQFSHASDFVDGLAAVKQGNHWGFINLEGTIAIAPQFDRVSDFRDGLAIAQVNGKQGFIDRSGKWAIEPRFSSVGHFQEGLAVARSQGKYGYIDSRGQFVISPQFDDAGFFNDGMARIDAGGARVYFINRQGQRVTQPGQFTSAIEFTEGLAAIALTVKGEERWGFIDTTGKVVIAPQFLGVGEFRQGLSVVEVSSSPTGSRQDSRQDSKYGYIDRTGKLVIPATFSVAQAFNGDLAAVIPGGNADEVSLTGYIDRQGKMVIAPSEKLSGLYDNGSFSEGLRQFKHNDRWGYVDQTGKIAIEARFDDAERFYQDRAKVRIGKQWAYIDRAGKIIIQQKPQLSEAS
jgi:hypothetical protein